jgi:hypothetical protein
MKLYPIPERAGKRPAMPLKRKLKFFEIFQKNFEKPLDKYRKVCYNRIMESTKECKPKKQYRNGTERGQI